MRTVMLLILAMAALAAAPALAGEPLTTATVDVTATLLPYAEVSLDRDTVKVKLPKRGGSKYKEIGGAVGNNCPVKLSAKIRKPRRAPGDWSVSVLVPEITEPGFREYGKLVRIKIVNIPPQDEKPTFIYIQMIGSELGEKPPRPKPGQVVVTVMMLP